MPMICAKAARNAAKWCAARRLMTRCAAGCMRRRWPNARRRAPSSTVTRASSRPRQCLSALPTACPGCARRLSGAFVCCLPTCGCQLMFVGLSDRPADGTPWLRTTSVRRQFCRLWLPIHICLSICLSIHHLPPLAPPPSLTSVRPTTPCVCVIHSSLPPSHDLGLTTLQG
jgi:hypothetical protein